MKRTNIFLDERGFSSIFALILLLVMMYLLSYAYNSYILDVKFLKLIKDKSIMENHLISKIHETRWAMDYYIDKGEAINNIDKVVDFKYYPQGEKIGHTEYGPIYRRFTKINNSNMGFLNFYTKNDYIQPSMSLYFYLENKKIKYFRYGSTNF